MTDYTPETSNKLEELAQAHEKEAFALLVEAIRDKDAKLEHRLAAANAIMDRARGKAKVAQPKDPNPRKQKAISMSLDTLMKIAQGAINRTEQSDKTRREAAVLEGEFTPRPRPRPVNEYAALPSANPATEQAPAPPMPSALDELLS